MLIRSMSALESPSSARRFDRCLEADGLGEGVHVPSTLCLAVMSAYLFTLAAAMLLL